MEQIRKQKGTKIPDRIRDAPMLHEHLYFTYLAFKELTTDRQLGMAEGPIPWTAIRRYGDDHDMGSDEFNYFLGLLRAMDSGYLGYRAKKRT